MRAIFLLYVFCAIAKAEHITFGYASSIAVYKKSAYLALPRSSCYNDPLGPTLLEVQWNADNSQLNSERKSFFGQTWGKCSQLQSAISLDVNNRKSRLWVLDQGNDHCPPKVVVYGLPSNMELAKWTLGNFGPDELSMLILDVSDEYGTLCYVGNNRFDKLTVVSYDHRK
ncbi:uncharacterized protein LOC116182696, partial [Photinus pyralis]